MQAAERKASETAEMMLVMGAAAIDAAAKEAEAEKLRQEKERAFDLDDFALMTKGEVDGAPRSKLDSQESASVSAPAPVVTAPVVTAPVLAPEPMSAGASSTTMPSSADSSPSRSGLSAGAAFKERMKEKLARDKLAASTAEAVQLTAN